ncbi:MAG: hypothetical protein HDR23_02150, partial [Lachnospiraceae bacterium]|nr:hypothetical protein [Lachnospiraceae bacterium]
YEICLNVERVMDMFSEELYELDKNTVQYMIDEMQETIDEQRSVIDKQKQEIDEIQEEHTKAIDEIQKEYVKEIDEMQKQGIRNTVKILKDLDVPEQEIRTRICEQYQISEEQVEEFID